MNSRGKQIFREHRTARPDTTDMKPLSYNHGRDELYSTYCIYQKGSSSPRKWWTSPSYNERCYLLNCGSDGLKRLNVHLFDVKPTCFHFRAKMKELASLFLDSWRGVYAPCPPSPPLLATSQTISRRSLASRDHSILGIVEKCFQAIYFFFIGPIIVQCFWAFCGSITLKRRCACLKTTKHSVM